MTNKYEVGSPISPEQYVKRHTLLNRGVIFVRRLRKKGQRISHFFKEVRDELRGEYANELTVTTYKDIANDVEKNGGKNH